MTNRIEGIFRSDWLRTPAGRKLTSPVKHILYGLGIRPQFRADRKLVSRIQEIEGQVQELENAGIKQSTGPVIFFNPSCFLTTVNLNGAAGLLSSWALRLSGHEVMYYFCNRGLSQCLLGSNQDLSFSKPPCRVCIAYRRQIYPPSHTTDLLADPVRAQSLRSQLARLSWEDLVTYACNGLDLAKICLPTLKWVERRNDLHPTEFSRRMLIEYMVSAANLAEAVAHLIDRTQPSALVVFNGSSFPEATAGKVAREKGVRVVSHESGYAELSCFFTHGTATEYSMSVPPDFSMDEEKNRELDEYLHMRYRGQFTMAGRQQWPDMTHLPDQLLHMVKSHTKVVSIFTNTVYDTSQLYANAYFSDMFDWLKATLNEGKSHTDVLFVVRAHPDEMRPGRESREPVADVLKAGGFTDMPNVLFIDSYQRASSYELLNMSALCLVYNSVVGLEAAMMGKYAIPGGLTRYRSEDCCYNIASREDYLTKVREILSVEKPVETPPEWRSRARRYFYYTTFRGYIRLSNFVQTRFYPTLDLKVNSAEELRPEVCPEMQIIVDGIVHGKDFSYPS